MRMMMRARSPVEAGNAGLEDGTQPAARQEVMALVQVEAVYIGTDQGVRTAMIFFDMKDSSDIPAITEPFVMKVNAAVELVPVMNQDALRAGMAKLGGETVVSAWRMNRAPRRRRRSLVRPGGAVRTGTCIRALARNPARLAIADHPALTPITGDVAALVEVARQDGRIFSTHRVRHFGPPLAGLARAAPGLAGRLSSRSRRGFQNGRKSSIFGHRSITTSRPAASANAAASSSYTPI